MKKTHEDSRLRKLPPLNSLKAFEAAARSNSFTIAADELLVSQGAISKQIKNLESYLGIPLFKREHQKILLTNKAKLYLPAIRAALEMIENSTDEIISSSIQQNTIRINVLPSLSSKWLIPKLIEFNNLYPSIKAVIEIGDGPIDFIKNEADLYIRTSDNPDWHDVYVQKLMDENLIAVASPKLKIKNPESLLVQVLLQHTSRPDMWNDYLRAIGFQNFQIEHSIGFQHFFMLIRAVLDGMGVALIPRTLIEDELQSGSLEQVITAEYENQFSYYILCKNIKIEQSNVIKFKDWLLDLVNQ